MESLSADVITQTSVHIVTCERMTDMRKMHTYLMSPSRFEVYPQQRIFRTAADAFIVSHSRLTVLSDASEDYRFLLTGDRSRYRPLFVRYAVNGSVVDLPAAVLHEIGCMGILGCETESRSIPVKAVHRPESQPRKTVGKIIPQRIALMFYRRMHRHSSRLVEDDDILVLISRPDGQLPVRFKETAVLEPEDYHITGIYRIDAPDDFATPGDAAFKPFQFRQQPP